MSLTQNQFTTDSVAITIDTEWSPDLVIEDVISLLDRYNVSATLFSTHKDGVRSEGHERGLHPNFLKDDKTEQEVLKELAMEFPEAEGIRTHSMYIHSILRSYYSEHNIQYESNYMEYLVEGLQPFWLLDEIVQFPVYFMDDFWLRSKNDSNSLPSINSLLRVSGMKVFDFHPIHIYLNTPTIEYYKNRQEFYQQPDRLIEERFSGVGVRTLFIDILEYLDENDLNEKTLSAIAEEFENACPYEKLQI